MSTIDVSDYLNSSGYSKTSSSGSSSGASDSNSTIANDYGVDMNTFLELLVTQLQYQDPLNPMDDTEFVSELATFSSLEQLTNINGGMTDLVEASARAETMNATSYIGKDVLANGNEITLSDGSSSLVYYTIGEDAADLAVNISDSEGNIVRTIEMGPQGAGTYSVSWDGTDSLGNEMANGSYEVSVVATDRDGNEMTSELQVTGKVVGVVYENDTNFLVLADGTQVNLLNVSYVLDTSVAPNDDASEQE